MVCKTLTVGAVAVPNISITDLVLMDSSGAEVSEIVEGTTFIQTRITMVNTGDADGSVQYGLFVDGNMVNSGGTTVLAGSTHIAGGSIDIEYLPVGVRNICAEII